MMALVVAATAAAAASPLERLARVDAWLADGASPPPRHWAVRGPGDVAAASTFLAGKGQKEVRASRLADGGAKVVVKALKRGGAFRFWPYLELIYLEFLRGEPGVPELLGGWATATSVVWVVRDAGRAVATGTGSSRSPAVFAAAYDARARTDPLGLAAAWLRCFRSFAERGGFVLTDFKADQFTLDARGDVYLVDGPAPNVGPAAAFARRRVNATYPARSSRARRARPPGGRRRREAHASPRREEFVVCGGWDPGARGSGGSFEDSVWSLDTSSLAWTREDPLPCGPVSRHGAATVGDRVFVHTFRGGVLRRDACGVLKAHATTGDAPEGLSMCATAGVDGGLLVFGGATKGGDFSGDAYVLDAKTYAWRRLAVAPGAAAPTPRGSCACAALGGARVLVFGGAGAGGRAASDETWVLEVDGGAARWERLDVAGPAPRVAAALEARASSSGRLGPATAATFGDADARRRVSLAPS
ncbi:hypothetical protein JL720_8486 [Aureococcus anophagefferens]|nr:hypothetical protein JL720_8486 [Aureococcus anophagefferens]